MYSIASDPRHRMIRLVLAGFWDVDEARAFATEQQAEVRKFGPPNASHLTLADVRDFAVQTQEVSAILRELVRNAASTSKRLAVVGGEGLVRIQVKRITDRDEMQLFATVTDAESWLLS